MKAMERFDSSSKSNLKPSPQQAPTLQSHQDFLKAGDQTREALKTFPKNSARSPRINSLTESDSEETLYIKSIPGAEKSILEGLGAPISELHEIEVTKEFLGID